MAKRDRLARDVVAAAMIERLAERQGTRVVAASGTSNGDSPEAGLMRGIIDLFAQYERAVIRSRTRAALAVKKAKGERVGGIPYGYRLADDAVHLEPDAREQAVIEQLVDLRDGMSLRKLASHCRQHGIVARHGPSVLSDAPGDPDWQRVPCDAADFLAAIDAFLARIEAEVVALGEVGQRWLAATRGAAARSGA